MNIQTKAIYLLAAAVIAQPFVSKTLSGTWGKYPRRLDALAACEKAEAKGERVRSGYRDQTQQSRYCFRRTDHFELRQREVRDYRSIPDWNGAKYTIIKRFYF